MTAGSVRDVGRLDEDGYLTLVGRSKEMIIRGGEHLPQEIEDVLASDPAVLEAAVLGVPDEKWGEVVVAFVQARPGATIDVPALKARCRDQLSGYKRPTAIHVLEALPKSAVGKLTRRHSATGSRPRSGGHLQAVLGSRDRRAGARGVCRFDDFQRHLGISRRASGAPESADRR